jgi:hypothetical protein
MGDPEPAYADLGEPEIDFKTWLDLKKSVV